VIDRTRIVVPGEDFASAFADLRALEPVASVPSLGRGPGCSFALAASFGQGEHVSLLARGSALLGSPWGRRGGVPPRGEHGTRERWAGGGFKIAAAAAP